MTKTFRPAGRGPYAVKLADIKPEDRVLNVGCFNGTLERYFIAPKSPHYFGIDMNAEAISTAQKAHSNGEKRFQVAPGEKIPFENEYFDKVLCLDTLEHVENEEQTLNEISRVLKPGGKLVLSVPHDFLNFLDPDELTRDMRNFVRKNIRKKPLLDHPEHRHYSEAQLRALLKDFVILRVHKSGTPLFWGLAMFYTAFGIPEKVLAPFRKLTEPLENLDYAASLPTGFNIMILACKKGRTA